MKFQVWWMYSIIIQGLINVNNGVLWSILSLNSTPGISPIIICPVVLRKTELKHYWTCCWILQRSLGKKVPGGPALVHPQSKLQSNSLPLSHRSLAGWVLEIYNIEHMILKNSLNLWRAESSTTGDSFRHWAGLKLSLIMSYHHYPFFSLMLGLVPWQLMLAS